jgi:hypothetical protein
MGLTKVIKRGDFGTRWACLSWPTKGKSSFAQLEGDETLPS